MDETGESNLKEAMFYEKDGSSVKCRLCPHNCVIPNGRVGLCGVRTNEGGVLYSRIYGKVSSMHPEPIEKKPFRRFLPGTRTMSFGTVGCNFKCDFCQNAVISQFGIEWPHLMDITPEEPIGMAKDSGCDSIAWTFNEPTIWYEFTYDSSKLAHKEGIKTVYVTNGFINPEPLKKIAPYLDAMNIDVKSFSEDFYRRYTGGNLREVLRTCELAKELNIHIELTYLVIPELNDNIQEIEQYIRWVLTKLGPEVPLHFTKFHPELRMMDREKTSASTLLCVRNRAKEMGMLDVFI